MQSDISADTAASGELTLRSVKIGGAPNEGTADLSDSAGTVRTYVAGAVLRDGTKLIEIHSDRVLLEKDQQLQTLHLAP